MQYNRQGLKQKIKIGFSRGLWGRRYLIPPKGSWGFSKVVRYNIPRPPTSTQSRDNSTEKRDKSPILLLASTSHLNSTQQLYALSTTESSEMTKWIMKELLKQTDNSGGDFSSPSTWTGVVTDNLRWQFLPTHTIVCCLRGPATVTGRRWMKHLGFSFFRLGMRGG